MSKTCIKTIRMPIDLEEKLKSEASELGISVNNYVLSILKTRNTASTNPESDFLRSLSKWIRDNYSKEKFPHDITLRVFHYIRDNKQYFELYKKIISAKQNSKISLHRQIGIMVKDVMDAKVIGRSITLDPNKNLIKTYSILVPKQ